MNFKVTIASVDERKSVITNGSESVREILDANGINYARATLMLDGVILSASDISKPLSEIGFNKDCTLSVTVKMDNA